MSLSNFRILLLYPNLTMSSQTPMAFSIFAAILKSKNCDIKVFDTTFYRTATSNPNLKKSETLVAKPFSFDQEDIKFNEGDVYEDFSKMVDDYRPDLIAVSMTEDMFKLGLSLLRHLGDKRPPTIAGGVFPTSAPEVVLSNKEFDMVCVGEGEDTLLEVCETMARGGDASNIRNLCISKNGSIQRNPMRPLRDLGSQPIQYLDAFDSSLFYRPMDGRVYKFICVEIHRGCPYTCGFCNSPNNNRMYRESNLGSHFRTKPVKNILMELDYLVNEWHPEYVYMVSDNFLMFPTEEFKELAKGYMKYRIPFWCNSRPETVTEGKMELLREMNCSRMNIGIEHGNEGFRRRMLARNVSNERISEAVRIASASGIPIVVNNIVGFPDETRELIFDSIKFARSLRHYTYDNGAFIFAPYHGTALRDYCLRKGYISPDLIVTGDITEGSLLKMPQITNDEIRGLARTFPLYVRMPEEDYPLIKRVEQSDEEGDRIYAELKDKYRTI